MHMRNWGAMLAVVGLAAGCGAADDRAAARATVERFYEAVRSGDGESACGELTDAAREQLASQSGQSCDAVVTRLDYQGGAVQRVEVAALGAMAVLSNSEQAFLSRTHHGWRISALACRAAEGPPQEIPMECEVQA